MRQYKILVITVLTLIWGLVGILQAQTTPKRPNILLVVSDDLGWTDLGSFGGEIKTPNLDALAKRGMQFTNFYVSVSCSPTRSMLLTGTDNHIAGLGNMEELITENQKGKPGYEGHLNNRVTSLAEVMKNNGYHTYMAGKWHLGSQPEYFPHARGFEKSFSMLYGGASYWSDMSGLLVGQEIAAYSLNGKALSKLPKDFYATRSYADFLMESIRENKGDGKPFLAYLAFTAPHDPLHVPDPWLSKYRGQYDEGYEVLKAKRTKAAKRKGVVSKDAPEAKRFHKLKAWDTLSKKEQARSSREMEIYSGVVENMDYHYGRVINFLKDIGEYENTIIIFLSDNGSNPWSSIDYPGNSTSKWFSEFDNSLENLGQPGSHFAYGLGWGSAGSGPLQLFKMTVGEGGIRSPMLIAGPGIKSSQQMKAFSYVWDVMPTILDLTGIQAPQKAKGKSIETMRGKSFKGLLDGSKKRIYAEDEFIGGEMRNGKWMRQGDYKAVSVGKPYGSEKWQLFNVVTDPAETHDLAKEQTKKLKLLQSAWRQYAEETGVVLSK